MDSYRSEVAPSQLLRLVYWISSMTNKVLFQPLHDVTAVTHRRNLTHMGPIKASELLRSAQSSHPRYLSFGCSILGNRTNRSIEWCW